MNTNIKKTFNLLLKKIVDGALWKKSCETSREYVQKLRQITGETFDSANISDECLCHIKNVAVLLASYVAVSLFLYSKFKIGIFLKEIFSLLCCYGAIFLWFIDRINEETPLKVAICVTSCLAPVLFLNNTFGTALICLLLMILCEFLLFEYLRGCNLFSSSIPVYIICEDENEAEEIFSISDDYKVLELIVLSTEKNRNRKISTLKSIDDISKWLRKINYMPFYPSPRRLLYYSRKINFENFSKLQELSAECSLPLFKVFRNTFAKQNQATPSVSLNISPISFRDFEEVNISSQDKSSLASVFKGKKVWICYDGRGSILDLVCAISLVNSADITLLCESEKLMAEAEQELLNKCANKNCKVKIFDLNLLHLQDVKPDILFYNIPIKSFHFGDYHLKEAVIKNVLDTDRLIKFAQSSRIPFVFILSSGGALGASNWIGATQRLGELSAQFADSQSRQSYTKFRIVRLPDGVTDKFGAFGKIVSSIFSLGYVNIDFPHTEFTSVYYRKDILSPLLKIIVSSMKAYNTNSCVYTIIPENKISLEELIKKVCDVMGLRKNKDVPIVYNPKSEEMDLEDFSNISEPMENTSIEYVFSTKFVATRQSIYESLWTVEEINKMTTRELISAVFQNLSEKIKK